MDGKTKLCGLIGNPVEHTKSPLIHKTIANRMEHNLDYAPFLVQEGELEIAIKGAHALNVWGLNVTVPYKSEVIKYLREIDSYAKRIGAVNTLVRMENGYKGYNTDYEGLYRAMRSEDIDIQGKDVILLGAGGSARAIAHMCAKYKAKRLFICNRNLHKAQEIKDSIDDGVRDNEYSEIEVYVVSMKDCADISTEKSIAIQATSVGLYPNVDEVVVSTPQFYEKLEAAVDIIYAPSETLFMKHAKAAGANTMNGIKMLIFQAIVAYELINQCSVNEEIVQELVRIIE